MRPCQCGKAVRLTGQRISVNRRRGIAHAIIHADGSAVCELGTWSAAMFKPYPRRREDMDYRHMIERWELQGPS